MHKDRRNIEHTPTKSSCGVTLLYKSDSFNYKVRKCLVIYKEKHLKSTFIEIPNGNFKLIIAGCIYKHPPFNTPDFEDTYLKNLLKKINLENKEVILIGYFNINLLNCDTDESASKILDLIYVQCFLPFVPECTCITLDNEKLIDNIS